MQRKVCGFWFFFFIFADELNEWHALQVSLLLLLQIFKLRNKLSKIKCSTVSQIIFSAI